MTPNLESVTSVSLSEDTIRLGAGNDRRLHPLSWLFVMIQSIKPFLLPLIMLLVIGRNEDSWQFWGLLVVPVVSIAAVVRYYTYRFRIDADELVVRSGLLQRNVRHVPLAKIQSVELTQNLLHRLLGVADVRLESAVGGNDAEAKMSVLSLKDAAALERLVEHHRGLLQVNSEVATATNASDIQIPSSLTSTTTATVRLHLPPIELIKLALASNRGVILVMTAFGASMQFGGDLLIKQLVKWPLEGIAWLTTLGLSLLAWVFLGLMVLAIGVIGSRVLEVIAVLLRDYGFKLEQSGFRLSIERGLLTRVRGSATLKRIQLWTLRQGMIMRWFKRSSLYIETAASNEKLDANAISSLIPIAPPDIIHNLLREWMPMWSETLAFRPLHPKAWRRISLPYCVMTLMLSIGLFFVYGLSGLWSLALIPWWIFVAKRQAAQAGYAITNDLLVWRSGWLDRRQSFAQLAKLQGVTWVQSPFDRRHGMASVRADTAGASALGHRLHVLYLPEAEARALYRRLASRIASTPFQW